MEAFDMPNQKKILVINGPNMNMLGIREPKTYGTSDFNALCSYIKDQATNLNLEVELFQSNHEGEIVDTIQDAYKKFDGIIINPAAYTHTSIAILDALTAIAIPTVEVHLSDIFNREDFRKVSYVSMYAEETISGKGFEGYKYALEFFA